MSLADDRATPFLELGVRAAPHSRTASKYAVLAAIWIAVCALVRYRTIADLPLGNGEAYYAVWARFPSWSYYDHPPLLAWLVRVATVGGVSAAAVRVVPVACASAFGALLFRLAARLFGERAAFFSLILATAIPTFLASSVVLNPEAPLAPLWVAYLLVVDRMRARDEPFWPLVAGAVLGLAFLAKYTALLLVPATLLYFFLSPARRWLRRPSFYGGGALALVMALPVIVWNAIHDWPTLQLHFVEREGAAPSVPGENSLTVLLQDASTRGASVRENLVRVVVGQIVAYSPLLLPLLLAALVRSTARAGRDDRDRFIASFSWPVLAVLLVAMVWVSNSEPHWAMVAFVPAVIAAGRDADEALRQKNRRPWLAIAGVAVSGVLFVLAAVHTHTDALLRWIPSARYDPRADPSNEMIGWDPVRASVERAVEASRGPVVLASSQYALCGKLTFETGDSPEVFCPTRQRSAFDFFGRRDLPAEATVVLLTSDVEPEIPAALQGRTCVRTDVVEVERSGRNVARYYVRSYEPASNGTEPVEPVSHVQDRKRVPGA